MLRMLDLPEDVLRAHVFSFVSIKDIVRLDNSMLNRAQRRLYLRKLKSHVFSDTVNINDSIADWVMLRKVFMENIKCSSELAGKKLFQIRKRLRFAIHLDISHCKDVRCGEIKFISKYCTSLRSFSMRSRTDLTRASVGAVIQGLALNCANIRSLDFSFCTRVTDMSLWAIGMHCHLLETLNLESCGLVTSQAVVYIVEHCAGLLELNLTNVCRIGPAAFEAIAAHCPLLRSLSVCEVRAVIDTCMFPVIRKCVNLETLFLEGTEVTESTVYVIAQHLPHLRQFGISSNLFFMEASLFCLLPRCGAMLTTIHMNSPYKATELTLMALSRCCPNLLNVSFKYWQHKPHWGLLEFLEKSQKLTSLCLIDCAGVTDEIIYTVADSCPDLRYLNLSGCTHVTKAILSPLITQCTKLETLRVGNTLRSSLH